MMRQLPLPYPGATFETLTPEPPDPVLAAPLRLPPIWIWHVGGRRWAGTHDHIPAELFRYALGEHGCHPSSEFSYVDRSEGRLLACEIDHAGG